MGWVMRSRSLKRSRQRGVKRGRELKRTPPFRHPNSVSSPCNSRRRDQETRGKACKEAGKGRCSSSCKNLGVREDGGLGETNLDFVKPQPLGEPDQFFCLLHASHLSTAALDDLGERKLFIPFFSLLPFSSTGLNIPPAHLAESGQGLLGILLAAGALLSLVQDILGGIRRKGDWIPGVQRGCSSEDSGLANAAFGVHKTAIRQRPQHSPCSPLFSLPISPMVVITQQGNLCGILWIVLGLEFNVLKCSLCIKRHSLNSGTARIPSTTKSKARVQS